MSEVKLNRGGVNTSSNGELSPSENNEVTIAKANSLEELIKTCPKNQTIGVNLIRAWAKINSDKYKKIVCSISGGSDSDVMLDICWRCDKDNKIDYVWFDTGLEYQATKDHLNFLEKKYGIKIIHYKALKPIPTSCRSNGQPFISKYVSECLGRLQKYGFKFEDEPLDVLLERYCIFTNGEYRGCKSALMWWCNANGEKSRFNINCNKWLKEFMIENPPSFKISNKCCKYAKKDVAHKLIKELNYDLNIVGVRKSEGGARATAYKNCFDESGDTFDNYRPLFWYKDSDKEEYCRHYKISHSKCYTEYGLIRTGCAGCSFGRDFEEELKVIQKHEPKLYKAVNNIFRDSYIYTRKYRDFCKKKREENK